ncbi:hypothetical protein [Limosilactobacillus ingluviei]|nr:hypothetical protein [Limosilactobacillus ingluviei]
MKTLTRNKWRSRFNLSLLCLRSGEIQEIVTQVVNGVEKRVEEDPTAAIDINITLDINRYDRITIVNEIKNEMVNSAITDARYLAKKYYSVYFAHDWLDGVDVYDSYHFKLIHYDESIIAVDNDAKFIDNMPDANQVLELRLHSPATAKKRAEIEMAAADALKSMIEEDKNDTQFSLPRGFSRSEIESVLQEKLPQKGYEYVVRQRQYEQYIGTWYIHITIKDEVFRNEF